MPMQSSCEKVLSKSSPRGTSSFAKHQNPQNSGGDRQAPTGYPQPATRFCGKFPAGNFRFSRANQETNRNAPATGHPQLAINPNAFGPARQRTIPRGKPRRNVRRLPPIRPDLGPRTKVPRGELSLPQADRYGTTKGTIGVGSHFSRRGASRRSKLRACRPSIARSAD